jgi:hypothetical protein
MSNARSVNWQSQSIVRKFSPDEIVQVIAAGCGKAALVRHTFLGSPLVAQYCKSHDPRNPSNWLSLNLAGSVRLVSTKWQPWLSKVCEQTVNFYVELAEGSFAALTSSYPVMREQTSRSKTRQTKTWSVNCIHSWVLLLPHQESCVGSSGVEKAERTTIKPPGSWALLRTKCSGHETNQGTPCCAC